VLKLWKFKDTGLHRFVNHSTLSELDEYIVTQRDAVLADVNKDWTADDDDLPKKSNQMNNDGSFNCYKYY
jgi:hypothetical protein